MYNDHLVRIFDLKLYTLTHFLYLRGSIFRKTYEEQQMCYIARAGLNIISICCNPIVGCDNELVGRNYFTFYSGITQKKIEITNFYHKKTYPSFLYFNVTYVYMLQLTLFYITTWLFLYSNITDLKKPWLKENNILSPL